MKNEESELRQTEVAGFYLDCLTFVGWAVPTLRLVPHQRSHTVELR